MLQDCFMTKNTKNNYLPGGESNPGLPRDRRGYLPLYYRGHTMGTTRFGYIGVVHNNSAKKKKHSLRAGFEPARENPIGFRVQRLNHSAITAPA